MIINKGFRRKRESTEKLPPGQYETHDFPVLSLGPTPVVETATWKLTAEAFGKKLEWDWKEFNALPLTAVTKDIHCVTKWSKFDTNWEGVSLDLVMKLLGVDPEAATHLIAYSYDGYTTNLPIEDVSNGKAMIALRYDGEMIPPEHGGPARLLVPHLYFWKSAKWVNRLVFTDQDEPGFWETRGYNNYGDPWKEERYTND